MIEIFSGKITEHLIKTQTINKGDREIYDFGIEQLILKMFNILTIFIIGIFLGEIWQSILIMSAFMIIRKFSGGYHASTRIRCYLMTTISLVSILVMVKYLPVNNITGISILIVTSGIILLLSPLATKNKPIDKVEYVICREKVLKIWFLESLVAFIFLILSIPQGFLCIAGAYILLSVALCTESIQRVVEKKGVS